jgi:DNA polymerase III subunit epsilon
MSRDPGAVARDWLERKPIFLDTETTGLRSDAEICEITLIDHDGTVLLDTLVKPMRRIPRDAMAIHGITNEMVEDMPTFAGILPQLTELLSDRDVVIYNAEYDQRILEQSAAARDVPIPRWWQQRSPSGKIRWHCAMKLYAEYNGDWDDYRGSYRWHRLGNAARHCGLRVSGSLHRARADTELTRQLVIHMASRLI